MNSVLFAVESQFWLELILYDLITWSLEQHYAATDTSQTESYSTKFFPQMELDHDCKLIQL